MHVYCPWCEYQPTTDDMWQCDCGHVWNTFATRAKCPACAKVHGQTFCHGCSKTVEHDSWYHERPPTEFIHSCENCARPLARNVFPQPRSSRQRVVRYLTSSKYERLLRDSALFLARLDQFQDRFEGALPKRVVQQLGKGLTMGLPEDEAERRLWTMQFYVSCWHAAKEESDAMWQLYCGKAGGVCVISSYGRLGRLETGANKPLHLGAVTYIDYRTQGFAFRDSFAPMMHKRKAFEYEKEVRLVHGNICEYLLVGPEALSTKALGYRLRCDLRRLVTRVLVSPYADDKYLKDIEALTREFAPSLAKRVSWSIMRDTPDF